MLEDMRVALIQYRISYVRVATQYAVIVTTVTSGTDHIRKFRNLSAKASLRCSACRCRIRCRATCRQCWIVILKIGRQDFCLQNLRAVSIAFRPISTEELITMAELPPKLLDNDGLSEFIDLCGSFIIVRGHGCENILYFVHQSAKDYQVAGGAQKLFSASLQREHGLVVGRSLDAMPKTLKKDICILRHPGAPACSASIGTRLRAISYICSGHE